MWFDPLIDPGRLIDGVRDGEFIAVDCRFDLSDPEWGRQAYLAGHVPEARYAHLDHDLSAPSTPGSGRHPLPASGIFAAFLSRIGWEPGHAIVAYDERTNAFAARLWWLMRYFGKPAMLLDGGLQAWQRAGYALERGSPRIKPTVPPELEPHPDMTVSAGEILEQGKRLVLVDARAPERFSGEAEPIDARAGHIPGALNRPMSLNVDESGRFKPAERLRGELQSLLGDAAPENVVNYCGSGVTACHNLLAMERAGFVGSKVYPGSWSEWSSDESRPVATARG